MKKNSITMRVVSLLAVLVLFTGCQLKEKEVHGESSRKEGEVSIFVISDPHLLSSRINDKGKAFERYSVGGDGKNLPYIEEIFSVFMKEVQEKKPDYLLVSGDLTNNGERASHEDLAAYFKSLEEQGTEVLVTPGNHDLQNPHARGFLGDKQMKVDTVTSEEFTALYKDFGFQDALYRDEASLSYVYEASEDLWILMMDTNRYSENVKLGYPQAGGILSLSSFQFMRQVLKEAKEKGIEVISASHHNSIIHAQNAVEDYVLDNSEEYVNILKAGGVKLNLTGHIHIQDIQKDPHGSQYFEIASGALSVYPHKYGQLLFGKEEGIRYESVKVPLDTVMTGSRLSEFESLDAQSKAFFAANSSSRIYHRLITEEGETEEDAKVMAEAVGELNALYFGGDEDQFSEKLLQHPGVQLLLLRENTRTSQYVTRMLTEEGPDDNRLFIPRAAED
ncbi:metallophosphoesterase [Proteiniclasticum ruminis]|uniref:3',5'-cyclic AMP phosphodiesterase CpdA n=1 Tax=Proteiniclasticum ruminis TaxID=398199 RepID=A0A1G8KQ72_9CLOT|nr:metallophosphoesterase [Proteiniclasticum ruminis]SDI45030.1 3',5'-cyclic AMP phosphodiesterase CpdA [Proteiniclasticum ruminis]